MTLLDVLFIVAGLLALLVLAEALSHAGRWAKRWVATAVAVALSRAPGHVAIDDPTDSSDAEETAPACGKAGAVPGVCATCGEPSGPFRLCDFHGALEIKREVAR
jgi:hypothetical protein